MHQGFVHPRFVFSFGHICEFMAAIGLKINKNSTKLFKVQNFMEDKYTVPCKKIPTNKIEGSITLSFVTDQMSRF